MQALFLVCFVIGLGLTGVLSILSGVGGHLTHGTAHLHSGHVPAQLPATHAHASTLAHSQTTQLQTTQAGGFAVLTALDWTLSWLSPLVLVSAAMWFGAGGLIADLTVPILAIPIAIAAAVFGAAIVRALINAFARSSSEPLSAAAEGAIGVLSASIRPGEVGEVLYVLEDLHRTSPAKSVDGSSLPRGAKVVIVRRERGMAYVSPLDPLSALADGSGSGPVHSQPPP